MHHSNKTSENNWTNWMLVWKHQGRKLGQIKQPREDPQTWCWHFWTYLDNFGHFLQFWTFFDSFKIFWLSKKCWMMSKKVNTVKKWGETSREKTIGSRGNVLENFEILVNRHLVPINCYANMFLMGNLISIFLKTRKSW